MSNSSIGDQFEENQIPKFLLVELPASIIDEAKNRKKADLLLFFHNQDKQTRARQLHQPTQT